ncbi:uncharacterized protein LOC100678985 [Nasonia vitripennis]|uniref:Uncharacterized protein n=1 Tax=Nasonia vitripennis TaxID=7425 RepID=A0A7M7LNA1_NASVI|nr:uncharacterized protein LOC100678985 [Nasonia vitripennis]
MKLSVILACALSCGCIALELCNNEASLQLKRRRKRALTFPKGSAFVMTMSMVKSIQLRVPANWNLDIEFDVIWPLPVGLSALPRKPTTTTTTRRPAPVRWRPVDVYWEPHRRHRRELYANFELALDSQGIPGKRCIMHAICEAKLVLNPPGLSLVEDVLRVIFSYPASLNATSDHYDRAYHHRSDCDSTYPCPFSLLHLLLNYNNGGDE